MKNLWILVVASAMLSGCELISDIIDEDEECVPASTLYGISSFDEAFHFVSVDAGTGDLRVLNELKGIEGVRGQAVINPELNQYYFTSEEEFVIVDIPTGKIVKKFSLEYPNTGNIQYNANTKNVNAISYFAGSFHFVEIDMTDGKTKVLKLLPIDQMYGSSANIDCSNNKYYFVSFRTIYTLDPETGEILDTMNLDRNTGGLRLIENDTFFGVDLTSNNFSKFDLKKDKVTKINSFRGSLSEATGIDIKVGFYYYFSGYATLSCVEISSGKINRIHTLPYNTFHLLPV